MRRDLFANRGRERYLRESTGRRRVFYFRVAYRGRSTKPNRPAGRRESKWKTRRKMDGAGYSGRDEREGVVAVRREPRLLRDGAINAE